MKLTESLYSASRGEPPSLANFARALRSGLHGVDVEPFDGMTLQTSLEAFMRVARHELVRLPELAKSTETDETALATLCDESLSLAVSLRNQGAPAWLLPWVRVATAYRLTRDRALVDRNPRGAIHFAAGVIAAHATMLVGPNDALTRADLDLARTLESRLGAGSLVAELEVWNDVFTSYRLYR